MAQRAAEGDGYRQPGDRPADPGGQLHPRTAWRCGCQSENGLLGIGPFPGEEGSSRSSSAGKQTITTLPGSSFFGKRRRFCHDPRRPSAWPARGHAVSRRGDLANWMIGQDGPGHGGAMDLVAGVKRVVVLMGTAPRGEHKILGGAPLPLTRVRRGGITSSSDLAVLDAAPPAFAWWSWPPASSSRSCIRPPPAAPSRADRPGLSVGKGPGASPPFFIWHPSPTLSS